MAEAYSDRTEELGIALKNAHAAGDTRAARILATELQKQLRRDQRSAKIRAAMPPRETGVFEDITSGFGAGLVGLGETTSLGIASLLEEEEETAARNRIRSIADSLRPEGGDPDSLTYQLSSVFGGIAGFAGAGLGATALGAPGIAVTTGLGALGIGLAKGEASERARAADSTVAEREAAVNDPKVIVAGALEAIPLARVIKFTDLPALTKLLEKIPPEKVETIGERIYSAGITGGAELTQEAASNILQNLTEQEYNDAREILGVDTAEEAALGGVAGALLQGFVDLFAPRRAGKTVGDVAKEEAEKPDDIAGLLEFKPEEPTQLDLALDTEEAEAIDGEAIRAQVFKGFKKPFDQLTEKQQKTVQNRIVALSPAEFDALERVIESPTDQIRRKVGLGDRTLEELSDQERLEVEAKIKQLPQKEITALNKDLQKQISPDQETLPGLEPESVVGPQLQRLPAPEKEKRALGDVERQDVFVPRRGRKAERDLERQLERRSRDTDTIAGETLAVTPEGQAITNEEALARFYEQARGRRITDDTPAAEVRLGQERAAIASEAQGEMFPTELAVAREAALDATETRDVDTASRVVTEEDLTAAGFATNNTRIRKKVLGKDLTDPAVRDALAEEANLLKSQKVKRGVTQLLEGAPSEQRRIPDRVLAPRRRRARDAAATVGTGATVGSTSVETDSTIVDPREGGEDTTEIDASDGRAVGVVGGDADGVDVGERGQRGALARKIEEKKRGRPRTKPTTPKMSKIDPTTGDAEVVFPDGGIERVRRETSEDPETGKKDFSFISLDRPDPDFPVDVGAPLLLGSTKETAIKRLTKVRKDPPVQPVRRATAEDIEGRRANEREASEIEKIRTAQRNIERKQRVAEGEKARTEQRERIDTADLRKVRAAQREATDRLEKLADERKAVRKAKEDSVEILYAPTRTEIELDSRLPEQVIKLLQDNKLESALSKLATISKDKFVKRVAKKLSTLTGDTQVQIASPSKLSSMGKGLGSEGTPAGLFVAPDNTIYLNEKYLDTHKLLHEMTHAATFNTIGKPSHPVTTQLQNLRRQVQPYMALYYGGMNPQKLENQFIAEGVNPETAKRNAETIALNEFVAEAFSNSKFQLELAGINPKGEKLSALQRFFKTIMDFLGLGKLGPKTAQREASRMIEEILAPAAKDRYGPTLRSMSDREGVTEIGDRIKDSRRDLKSKEGRKAFGAKLARDISAVLDKDSTQGKLGKKAVLGLLPNQAVLDIAVDRGINGAKKVLTAIENQRGDLTVSEQNTRRRLTPIFRWANNASENTMKAWNNLIYDSTLDEVDPALTPAQARKKYGKQTVEGTDQLKVDRHKELHAIYMGATLGKDGRQAYDSLRQFYKDQYNELLNALKGRIDNADINDEQKTTLKNELLSKLLERTGVEPYFPLTREGTHWLAVKNPEALSESAVFAFKTQGDRLKAAEDYAAQGFDVEVFNPDESNVYTDPPSGSFISQVLSVLNANDAAPDVKEQVMRLFLESLPESSFAKGLVKRKKTSGFDVDAVEAARTKAYDLARQTERIKNTNRIMRLKDEFLETVPKDRRDSAVIAEVVNRANFAVNPPRDTVAKNANRLAFMWTIGWNPSSAIVNLSQIPLFAYPMLAGKHGYGNTRKALGAATKLFMGSPSNKSAETLFGDNTTPASVREAFREGGVGQALEAMQDKALKSIDNYYTFTRDSDGSLVFSVRKDLDLPEDMITKLDDLKPLIELASRRGQLNSSFLAETLNVDQSGRKQSVPDVVTNISALMFHEAEVMNRQVTLITAYDLALNKLTGGKKPTPEQQQQAAEEAIYETQQINGGATLETGPRFARDGVGRVALMYKNYGIQMYYTMLKTGKEALDIARASFARDLESKNIAAGMNLETAKAAASAAADAFRSDAAKQLAGVHLSALFFAGVQGIPIYGAVTMLADMFFLGDDDEEADFYVRRAIDNELLYRGLVSELSGFDVAQRVKLTDLLFEADRFNSNPSPEEELMHLVGGPAWSVYSRGRKGIDKIAEGDLVRGMEDLLPGAVRNAMQAVRFGIEGGIRTRRGDFMYDDITAGDLVAKVLGFPPNEYTKEMDETSFGKRMSDRDIARRARLAKKLFIARQYRDFEAEEDIRREMDEFNASAAVDRSPELFIDGEYLDNSFTRHSSTSAKMHNGVLLPESVKAIVEEPGFF